MSPEEEVKLAEAVRVACIEAAAAAAEQAAMQGLCDEGQAEAAISALQMLDIEQLLDARRNQQEN